MARKQKMLWVVRDSSDSLFFVAADTLSEVYRVFAREQLKMEVGDDFDPGNVDVDIARVPKELKGVAPLDFAETEGV